MLARIGVSEEAEVVIPFQTLQLFVHGPVVAVAWLRGRAQPTFVLGCMDGSLHAFVYSAIKVRRIFFSGVS